MSLGDLASLGSFASGVAVLVSLVFLYFQMKQIGAQISQSERNQRASIRASRASRTVDFLASFANPSMSEAVAMGNAGSEDMSSTQITQYTLFCLGRFINAEDAFSQNAGKLLDEEALADLVMSLTVAFSNPGFRASWSILRQQFHGEFVDFIDGVLAQSAVRRDSDASARWRAAFSAQRENSTQAPAAPPAQA